MHNDEMRAYNTPPIQILIEDDIDFDKYLKETEPGEKVRPAIEYLDDVMHALAPAHDSPDHPKMPFADNWLYFSPGEVTAWGGFNGSGKSMLQGQTMTTFCEAGQKVCIASFEMKPAKTLARIVRQVFGVAQPSKAEVSAFLGRNNGRLWLYDQQGTVHPEKMIAVIKHCAEKLGCHHIAIDSLMKCVRGFDDYNGQKNFIDEVTAAARDYKIHVHIVVHLKKGETDERMPTRMDISGAGAIADLVDNVLLVWRNKRKERGGYAGKPIDHTDPDAVLICDKSRNWNWEGRTKLWFDKSSMKFTDFYKQRGIL